MGRGNVGGCGGRDARAGAFPDSIQSNRGARSLFGRNFFRSAGIQLSRNCSGRPFFNGLVVAVCLGLGGCLPGLPGVDDGSSEASFASSGEEGGLPVVQSVKANFLSFSSQPARAEERPARGAREPESGRITVAAGPAAQGRNAQAAAEPPRQERIEAVIEPPAQSLRAFYGALSALTSGQRTDPVTILHLGDDHVAADLFTSDLRGQLQSRFGNAGRGLLPPGVFPASDVKFDRGGAWTLKNSAQGDPGLYGVTGLRMESAGNDAWVRMTHTRGPFDWLEVTLGTGPGYGTAIVSIDGEPKLIPTSSRTPDRTTVRITSSAREVIIRPRGDGGIALLSLAVGLERPGIRYVNLGLPGATAATPGKWDINFVAADFQRVQPDLVILGYGTREGFSDKLDIKRYELRASILLQQLKQLAPQASFMLIGPPDAARLPAFAAGRGGQACRGLSEGEVARYRRLMKSEDHRLMRWHAPPKLDEVRHALRNVASAHGAYFWDWSRMMGGSCSIHAWAFARPPLASPDHVTLTAAGAERSARALFLELMNGYTSFTRNAAATAATGTIPMPVKASGPARAKKAKAN